LQHCKIELNRNVDERDHYWRDVKQYFWMNPSRNVYREREKESECKESVIEYMREREEWSI
jgi:hypothetical protein